MSSCNLADGMRVRRAREAFSLTSPKPPTKEEDAFPKLSLTGSACGRGLPPWSRASPTFISRDRPQIKLFIRVNRLRIFKSSHAQWVGFASASGRCKSTHLAGFLMSLDVDD